MGWVGKAALFVRANDMYRANDAGRNALDAITRVMILTGHSRDDLEALQLSLGNPKP
jgi:Tfp pilus assembly protein PilW